MLDQKPPPAPVIRVSLAPLTDGDLRVGIHCSRGYLSSPNPQRSGRVSFPNRASNTSRTSPVASTAEKSNPTRGRRFVARTGGSDHPPDDLEPDVCVCHRTCALLASPGGPTLSRRRRGDGELLEASLQHVPRQRKSEGMGAKLSALLFALGG